jgi:energy-coupling factor transporter ATP-binding protein EcfA2
MTPAISVAGLSRRYRGQLALDQVNFDIEPGSVTGLLGRNGAGKTTLLRILAGQEFPSSGRVAVLGGSPVDSEKVLHRMVFVREDQRYPDYGSGPGFQGPPCTAGGLLVLHEMGCRSGRRAGRGLLPAAQPEDHQTIGSQESAVVAGALDDTDRARARSLRLRLRLEPLTLQQVVVQAAGQHDIHARERTSA